MLVNSIFSQNKSRNIPRVVKPWNIPHVRNIRNIISIIGKKHVCLFFSWPEEIRSPGWPSSTSSCYSCPPLPWRPWQIWSCWMLWRRPAASEPTRCRGRLWKRGGCGDQLKGCWWMEEILHHLGWWDKPPSSWCSISSINWSPVPTFMVPILSVSWMTTKTSVSEHVVRWMPMPINLLYPTCLRFAFVPTIPDFAVLYVFRLFYSFSSGSVPRAS